MNANNAFKKQKMEIMITEINKKIDELRELTKSTKLAIEQLNNQIRFAIQPIQNLKLKMQNLYELISETYIKVFSEISYKLKIISELFTKEIESSEFIEFYESWGWLNWLPIFGLYYEYKNGNFSFLEDFNKLLLSNDKFYEGLLNEVLYSKIYVRRKKFIEKILNCHKAKDFICSIPLALIQIEGVVRDLGVLKGCLENKENPRCCPTTKKEVNFGKLVIDLFGEYAELGKKKVKEPLKRVLRDKIYTCNLRHSIIHGNKIDYEDPILSAHLIAVLISLAHKAKEIENSSNVKPYWEKREKKYETN